MIYQVNYNYMILQLFVEHIQSQVDKLLNLIDESKIEMLFSW